MGTLEFAAIHGRYSYLQAIAKVNGMPTLMDLEREHGRLERGYSSFYVPRRAEARYDVAIERFGRFLTHFGVHPDVAKPLYQRGGVEVRKNGSIRFFPKDDYKNAVEYEERPDKTWAKTKRAKTSKPFHSSSGKGDRLLLFGDPIVHAQKRGKDLLSARVRNDSILVLLEPSADSVTAHLQSNPHIKHIEIVTQNVGKPSHGELDLFGNLKSRLKGLGVNVRLSGYEQAMKKPGPELGL